MKQLIIFIAVLTLTSCNRSQIESLENEVAALRKENSRQQSLIQDLQSTIEQYENYFNNQRRISQQRAIDEHDAQLHRNSAEQHLRTAEFWRQQGNDFLYESSMRNTQSELDMIR